MPNPKDIIRLEHRKLIEAVKFDSKGKIKMM